MTGETSGLRLLMVTPRYFPYIGGIEGGDGYEKACYCFTHRWPIRHRRRRRDRTPCPHGDPFALQKAIQCLIQCLLDDPVRREHMGTMAKQRVVEFQAKTVVSRIEQAYQEVLTS